MKKLVLISFWAVSFFSACSEYPNNPSKNPEPVPAVSIHHVQTDYVPTEPPTDGLLATKVNILILQLRAEAFTPKAIEFYGRATLVGPPDSHIHSIHLRTDSLSLVPNIEGYSFNTLDNIEPGSTYVIVRPKFPTNSYAPFAENQGKIDTIEFTEVWAWNADGQKISVQLLKE